MSKRSSKGILIDNFWFCRCNQACSIGTFGKGCSSVCTCQNGATCDMVTGACYCAPGWKGVSCNESCAIGFFGQDCMGQCRCQNGATCNHTNGNCTCAAGYRGDFCENQCAVSIYAWYGSFRYLRLKLKLIAKLLRVPFRMKQLALKTFFWIFHVSVRLQVSSLQN